MSCLKILMPSILVNLFTKHFNVYVKISSITNLAYTVSLPAVENKIWTLVILVKKVDYDAKISDIEKNYFTA